MSAIEQVIVGRQRCIYADPAPEGQTFYKWTGDIDYLVYDPNANPNVVEMPAQDITLTATYGIPLIALDYFGLPTGSLTIQIYCDGNFVASVDGTFNIHTGEELIAILNNPFNGYTVYGTYYITESEDNVYTIGLIMPLSVKEELCPEGVITFRVSD